MKIKIKIKQRDHKEVDFRKIKNINFVDVKVDEMLIEAEI